MATTAPAAGPSPDLLATLRRIVGEPDVLVGDAVRNRAPGFFMARIEADAIIRPRDALQLSQVLALCNDAGQPVVVQGGMSGWVRATQTKPGEIALSMERMNRILEIDPVNRTATVEAGVILQNLENAVHEHGLTFPVDLGGRGSCQLGGNASTNAGGERVIRYGMMRQQVLGLEVVLANGRVVSAMNHMLKNNTGYDLKQLFIGSEGTLGAISKLVLRLRELPVSSNTALISATRFEQVAGLLRHMDRRLGGILSAFELIDREFYALNTLPGRHPPPIPADQPLYVIVEALGGDQERDADLFQTALLEASEQRLADHIVLAGSERERAAIWVIREDLQHVVNDLQPFYAFDVSLPVSRMENYMEQVRARLKQAMPEGRIAFLGHVGDGNLHIAIGAGGADDRPLIEACVYEPLRPYRGSVSAEHGIGLEKKPWLAVSRSEPELALMRDLKRLLDPNNILNPGKLLDLQ